jgi:SET domain-containing protein
MSKFDVKEYDLKVKKCRTGRGLFANEDIPKGVCFLEYKGKELSEEEKYTSESRYLFEINKRVTLDGWVKGNNARFINYACKPNAEFETRKDKVYVFSIKKIKKGDQITIDYGEEYYNEYIKGNCLCDSCIG